MKLRIAILTPVLLSAAALFGQEIKTPQELSVYLPEKLPVDVLEIYNQEMATASYLPAIPLKNVAELNFSGKFTKDSFIRLRTAEYNKLKGTLKISLQGKNLINVTNYHLKGSELNKTITRIENGKEKPMMKELKKADSSGRIIYSESYYHHDTGWVSMEKTRIKYTHLKNGLLLEVRTKGADIFQVVDSVWYYFENGRLTKKSTGFDRWSFSYTPGGKIKKIERVQKDYNTLSETVYNTDYYYEKDGKELLMLKISEDKYYNTETRFVYSPAGNLLRKTILKKGDNEVKEINSFTWDESGHLQALGQTIDGVTTIKASVECDEFGNMIILSGEQFPATVTIQYKNGQGSSSHKIEGPGELLNTITIKYVK